MTIAEAKQKLVALARAEVGYREGADNYTKYAEDPRITKLYGWNVQNQPWCCTFVNWCFLQAFDDIGGKMTYGGSAACATQASYYRAHGAFKNSPEVGDQIFFYSGGGINHTGIVVEVNAGSIRTVEGNYSDKVSLCSYAIGNSAIAGYGRPDWYLANEAERPSIVVQNGQIVVSTGQGNGAAADPTDGKTGNQAAPKPKDGDAKPKENHAWTLPTLSWSITKSNWNVLLQALLIAHKFDCGKYGTDGYFGKDTKAAVVKARQYYGLKEGVTCDGDLWAELLKVNGR